MKGDSTGGKRQDQPLRQDTDSARESGPSLDTLDSLVGCCPTCETAMPIQRVHNGVMWVGHGICSACGWASDHADPLTPNAKHEGQA